MSQTLYLLDVFSLVFQVFHAIPEMTGPKGQPTNAVFGLTRDLLNLLRDRQPDSWMAALDSSGPTFRHQLYTPYKANRSEMPADLQSQIPLIHQVLEAFRIPILALPQYEADDILADVAHRASQRGIETFIVTTDKDARQLISDRVRLYNVRTAEVLDRAGLERQWGIRPDQVVDLLALTGDSVDNVPGIPGIGLKTAQKLLQEFGSLEGILANLDQVAGTKRRESLRAGVDVVRQSRELVVLKTGLPLTIDWERSQVSGLDRQRLRELFLELGFHRFAAEIDPPASPAARTSAWNGAYHQYHTIDTPARWHAFLDQLRGQARLVIDTETTSLDPHQAELVGLSFAWREGEAWYVPVRGPEGQARLDAPAVLDDLRPILESEAVEKVGQNIKYDALALRRAGIRLGGIALDTMVASYLLNAGERSHSLDQLALRYLNHTKIATAELLGTGKKQLRMDQVDVARVAQYACEDADATWRLGRILEAQLRAEGLWDLYQDLEQPLIDVLIDMEVAGIRLDTALLGRLSREFETKLAEIEQAIYAEAGHPFNIGSPAQLRVVLFDELKLPTDPKAKKTKTGVISTDQETLEQLAVDYLLPRLVLEHRRLAKLKSTYVDALPQMVNPWTGRVHASFNQGVTATGRLSSSDPNLQNIPVRTEEGRQIRQAFLAGPPGWKLLTADYSQIELRILAHYSGDPELVRGFETDRDIHQAVAAQIYGVAPDAVTTAMRRTAKTVNFGVIYGLSPFGLATRLGMTQEGASEFIEAYFQIYAGVDRFISRTLEAAQKQGYVTTLLGRRRQISGIRSTTGHARNLAERTAVNTVIQGSAADLIKRAMIAIHRRLARERLAARMLLQIHDELVFEVPWFELDPLARLVAEEMTSALVLDVPLKVDLAAGDNWLAVEPLEPARMSGAW